MFTQSNILKWSLAIAIIIVLNLFFTYAASLVFESPDRDAYFNARTEEACLDVGGTWEENIPVEGESRSPKVEGWCDAYQQYEDARAPYERNVFITLIVLGVVSLFVGLSLSAHGVVAAGLSYGGLLALIIASIGYWENADNILRLVILGVALVTLLWIGIKKEIK